MMALFALRQLAPELENEIDLEFNAAK